jgi:hypothetical protein
MGQTRPEELRRQAVDLLAVAGFLARVLPEKAEELRQKAGRLDQEARRLAEETAVERQHRTFIASLRATIAALSDRLNDLDSGLIAVPEVKRVSLYEDIRQAKSALHCALKQVATEAASKDT